MWKEIPNTDGLYFASEEGQIKSAPRMRRINIRGKKSEYLRNGKILKQAINSHGYPCVTIKFLNGTQKVVTVHRLIAMTFIPNVKGKPQVNHIDGDKRNNNVSNLEWCTASENLKHAFNTGLNKGRSPWRGKYGKQHFNSMPVIMCDKDGNEIKEFESMSLAASALGKPNGSGHISDCAHGKRNVAFGYKWKLKT